MTWKRARLSEHDDVIKWKHFPRYWPFVRGSPVNGEFPAQRTVTRNFDVFFDLRLNKRWVNNREAGDLRRHRAHYDVIVMSIYIYIYMAASSFINIDSGNDMASNRPSNRQDQCWLPGKWTIGDKLQWNFNQNVNIFIEENEFWVWQCRLSNGNWSVKDSMCSRLVGMVPSRDQIELHRVNGSVIVRYQSVSEQWDVSGPPGDICLLLQAGIYREPVWPEECR